MLPKPTAEPAVARITPSLLPKFARFPGVRLLIGCVSKSIFLYFSLQKYKLFLNFAPKL